MDEEREIFPPREQSRSHRLTPQLAALRAQYLSPECTALHFHPDADLYYGHNERCCDSVIMFMNVIVAFTGYSDTGTKQIIAKNRY